MASRKGETSIESRVTSLEAKLDSFVQKFDGIAFDGGGSIFARATGWDRAIAVLTNKVEKLEKTRSLENAARQEQGQLRDCMIGILVRIADIFINLLKQ